ncbi:MAG: hypothetical protein QXU18_06610 [Thermoplasmatales archaeon]
MRMTREELEGAFDVIRNDLEGDKTYLQDNDAVKGYFFIILVTLYIRYMIINILRNRVEWKTFSERCPAGILQNIYLHNGNEVVTPKS